MKMYAKTKELGPIGGMCTGHAPPLDLPMLMYLVFTNIDNCNLYMMCGKRRVMDVTCDDSQL